MTATTRLSTYALFLISFLCLCGFDRKKEEPQQPNQVANYFNVLATNRDFSGVVLIGNKEGIISSYVAGYVDFKLPKEHSLKSRFSIASLSKTFTAAAILQLKKENKIKLEDKVKKYLPDFKYGDEITVLQLLRHESGLANLDEQHFRNQVFDSDRLLQEISKQPLLFKPGTDESYSNSGFAVLAKIVESVSRLPFQEYLKQKIFRPVEMKNSGDLRAMTLSAGLVKAYFPHAPPELVKEIPTVNYSLSLGSGSLFSSAEDLWKWGRAVLNKSTVDFFAERYPYGWGRDSVANRFCLTQTGMIDGFVASLFLFPEENIVVVLLSNIENGLWVGWTKDVAKMVFQDPSQINYPSLRQIRAEAFSQGKISHYTGTFRRDSKRFVVIKEEKGNLFLHLDGYYRGHYLTPIGQDSFDLRSFTGRIVFTDKDSLLWKLPEAWGGGEEVYNKTN